MKTLVVGDLHLKQRFVLSRIDALLDADAAIGRVVFLGDACDDWGATEADELDALEYQAQWAAARRERGLRVDVLLGSHDFCYIRGRRGPGSMMTVARELRTILEEKLQAQLACAVGPYLCTHAGLTNVWVGKFMPDVSEPMCAEALAQRLNEMLADSDNWVALDSCPPSRGGWSLPGPLWA
ncbi:MAG: metallophosphoesterase, partial [Eggerthellaceae bacterium]|nr:metallophosphoesterase [Eggerthellaceae bacterium]